MKFMLAMTSVLGTILLVTSACGKLGSRPRKATAAHPSTRTQPVEQPPPNPRRYGGAANYVTNPSFEEGFAPWLPWGSNSTVRVTRRVAKIGRAAAKVIANSPAQYGIQHANAVNSPAAGDAFVLSAWLRSADRSKKVVVLLQGSRPSGRIVVVGRRTLEIPSASWRHIGIQGRVRAPDLTGINIYILVLNSIGIGDAFFLDGASLTPA